jgi:hypothetical protein
MDDVRDSANCSHLAVLCPRCQVTKVLNEMFSGGSKNEGAQTGHVKVKPGPRTPRKGERFDSGADVVESNSDVVKSNFPSRGEHERNT